MAGNWFADAWANPKFKQFVSEAGQDLGYGLTQGTNFGNALGIATRRTQELQPQRDYASQQKREEAERQAQITETAALKDKYTAWFTEQGQPQIAQAVADGIVEPGKAYWDFIAPKPPKPPISVGPGETLLDPVTMQPVYQGAPDPQDQFGNEKDLYAQYAGSDPVKMYETVKSGYERVRQSAALQTGAGDMGLIYGYMKMLDPGSVVRESEFATAAQAGSYGEQIQGMVSRVINGERLPESVRQEFVQLAEGIYSETAANLGNINDQFTTRAQNYNVDPSMFIRQPESYKPLQGIVTMPNGNTVKPL